MNRLIRYVLYKYANEMNIPPEKKLDILLDILTDYLKSKNCLK